MIGSVEMYDGTNVIGTSAHPVRTDPTGTTTQPVSLNTTPSVANGNGVIPVAGATAGATPYTGISTGATTTGVNVKGSAGTLYSLDLDGVATTTVWVKLYDKATAPTCGTDTPVQRYLIPLNSTAANGGGHAIPIGPVGMQFANGISYCLNTGIVDSDTAAVAANTAIINMSYK